MLFLNTHNEKKRYIFLDLTGPSGWEQNDTFVDAIETMGNKHTIAFMTKGDKLYGNIKKAGLQCKDTGKLADVWMTIFKDLNIDKTDIIIMTNNKENMPVYVQALTSVIYLQTKNCVLHLDIQNMPDAVWNEEDFYHFIETNRLPNSYLAERIGFENIERAKVPLLKLPKKVEIPGTTYEADLIFTGRYFTVKDQRFYSHPLSRLMISFKSNYYFYPVVARRLIGDLINAYMKQDDSVQNVMFVPPRPGKKSRFKGVEKHIKKGVQVDFDTLYVKEDYASPSNYRTFADKHKNVAGKIGCRNKAFGHILLVDDVFTSGATTAECAKQLYEHGAKKVTILPLAYTQRFDIERQPILPAVFDDAGNEYNIGFRKGDDNVFWYTQGENNEYKSFKSYEEIKEEYLANHGWRKTKDSKERTFTFDDKYAAIIFDLDNTLLQTDHLKQFRQANKRDEDRSLIKNEHIIIGPQFVKLLRATGRKLGIVTSSPTNYASSRLSLLGYEYDCLITSGDTLKGKPSPDPLIKCCKKLNMDPEYILNIGDQPGDLEAGKWCGMLNIHIDDLRKSNLFSFMIEWALEHQVDDVLEV